MRFLLIALFSYLFATSIWAGQTDPKIKWQQRQSPHFLVVYPQGYDDIAIEYAKSAERAHDILFPIFGEAPTQTLLILLDNTDVANGFASFFPFPHIAVNLTLPSPNDEIGHNTNWMDMLLLHEYTHILNMHPAHGFYAPLKYIFGSPIRPNAVLPSWYLEGLAVELESRLTSHGRLRSPLTAAILRALAQSEKLHLETLDKLNEGSIPKWPGGRRPYLLGGALMHEAMSIAQPGAEGRLNQRYSRRLPFLLHQPIEDETGFNWHQLLESSYQKIAQKSHAQIEQIKQQPQKVWKKSNFTNNSQLNPNISPSGQYLIYVAGDYHKGLSLNLIKRKRPKENFLQLKGETILHGNGIDRIAWQRNSKEFYYCRMAPTSHWALHSNLHVYNIKTKKSHQLTTHSRCSEPALSPSGKKLFYIANGKGTSILMAYNIKSQQQETLVAGEPHVKLSSPTAITSKTLLYIKRTTDGVDQLWKLNLQDKTSEQLLPQWTSIRQLKKTRIGLLFVSERNGVPNLYRLDKTLSQVTALSNTSTAIYDADWDRHRKELIASQLTDEGPKLFSTRQIQSVTPPQVTPMFDLSEPPITTHTNTTELGPSEDYKTLKYFIPRYWIPFVYPIEDGFLFQGSTSAGDPLGKHGYDLGFSYDSLSKKISYGINYFNSMSPIDFDIGYSEINEVKVSSGLEVKNLTGTLIGSYYLSSDNAWQGGFGGIYSEATGPVSILRRTGPLLIFNYNSSGHFTKEPRDNKLSAQISHQYFIEQSDYLSYHRSTLSLSHHLIKPLKVRHHLHSRLVASYAPELGLGNSLIVGDTAIGASYAANLVNSNFLVRGYPSGTFVGRSLAVANLEYSFPLADLHSGLGTFPLFFHNLNFNIFADAITLDGGVYRPSFNSYFRKELGSDLFYGSGVEFVLNTSAAYHFPLYFKVGLYYGFDQEYAGGFQPFFGFGLSGLDSLN